MENPNCVESQFMFNNVIFFCERLLAEFPSEVVQHSRLFGRNEVTSEADEWRCSVLETSWEIKFHYQCRTRCSKQAILASAFAKKDYKRAAATASRVLQLGLVLGFLLAAILGAALHFGAKVFTKDDKVLHLISIGLPFVAGTQPVNALAFVFDGVNFGASDFGYAAASLVAIVCILCLLFLSSTLGFIGLWFGLTIYIVFDVCSLGFSNIGFDVCSILPLLLM
ncbi:PREDICTED: protein DETOXIFICATION 42-like isoform X2 [Camelina sativa]|uniref:Protein DETOXIFICATION 42-like isoform X2 n=1 Tax=Camelina sativa TaxID=90675 RepID=A0ABM0Y1B4_CAMSA|nr:PREDICTED: protein DETOXIFICATION 42-like isoform X2 [Camelina sativa]